MKRKEIEVLGERKEMKNAKMFDETGQTQHSLSLSFVADLSILDFGEHLLSLEPPLSENDYSFALGTEEGLSDLFDFKF